MKSLKKNLKKTFKLFESKKRLIIVFLILMFLALTFSQYIKTISIIVIFIVLGGVSKLYHRLFKSTLGIDLIFFTTLLTSLVYKNIIIAVIVAYISLIIADNLGSRLNYTSLISLIGLTSTILLSKFLITLPLIISMIILTLTFEIISGILYYFMGSSPQRILLFITSHLLFNLFMIFSFGKNISNLMG